MFGTADQGTLFSRLYVEQDRVDAIKAKAVWLVLAVTPFTLLTLSKLFFKTSARSCYEAGLESARAEGADRLLQDVDEDEDDSSSAMGTAAAAAPRGRARRRPLAGFVRMLLTFYLDFLATIFLVL